MTTIYPGFSFTDEYNYNTVICRSDNGSGLVTCEEYGTDDEGNEVLIGERRLTHQEIAHAIRDKVEWCIVSPEQWQIILDKLPADVIEDALCTNAAYVEYNEGSVGMLLQEGDHLFEGFNAWLLSELNVYNRYCK